MDREDTIYATSLAAGIAAMAGADELLGFGWVAMIFVAYAISGVAFAVLRRYLPAESGLEPFRLIVLVLLILALPILAGVLVNG